MEFRFNLNEIFKEPVAEIGSSLIPPGFSGDKRALWDTQSKVTQIVNAMGEASANAQGLTKPITTADRLRNSEHKLYLLIDQSANNGKGAVTGMLKTGEKGLYVFDRAGQHYQVSPPCVLDFYIHESRQRSGFGKNLFEHMLQKQQIEPVKMAIDRPSDKLLGFLNKHYGLNNPVKQMNNYVVYDGFFPRSSETPRTVEEDKSYTPGKKQSANGLQHGIPSSPYGRYAARRPPCSMGQIIHNDSAVIKRNQEPTGVRSEPITNSHGQHYMYNSNQVPAWQATQSVPNMHYAYSQNQQNCAQNPQQFIPHPQYPQYQQFPQNQSAQYSPNSGNHPSNATSQNLAQSVQQNQVPAAQHQAVMDQLNQNAVQNYQQADYNFTMGQGDATSQSYKDQNMIDSNTSQVSNPSEVHGNQEGQSMAQYQPLYITYQGQNYCFNPQTQQYQIIPNEYQQSLAPNVPQGQQSDYNRMPVQKAHHAPQQTKEPLQPQHLDGTVRKAQQSASMPTQKNQEQQNLPILVQESVSVPLSYQHQPATDGHQANTGLQTYNPTTIRQESIRNQSNRQMVYQNQPVAQMSPQHQNQPHTQVAWHNQTNSQMGHQNQAVIQTVGQSSNINPPGNIAYIGPTQQGTISQETTLGANQIMHQTPNVTQNVNNQMPMLVQPTQNVQPIHSIPQDVVNYANPNIGQQPQQNVMASTNTQMIDQNQLMPQTANVLPDGNQNVYTAQATQNVGLNNVAPQQVNNSSNQIMTPQPVSVNQPVNNQMMMANQPVQNVQQVPIENVQHVPSVPQVQQQQNMKNQYDHSGHQSQYSINQQKMSNQNAWQQDSGNRGVGQETNRFLQNIASNVNLNNRVGDEPKDVRQNQEVDLSKGYPPQHHQRSVASRPPIIIRN